MKTHNKKLEDLIEAINHISLNQEDLLGACLEFSDLYFKKDEKSKNEFDRFWGNPDFIEQACMSAREAVVLALHSITLEEDIDFALVIDGCLNKEAQNYNNKKISQEEKDHKVLNDFYSSLRKEIFSRIFSQNKKLQKATELSKNLLNKRYQVFMDKIK